MPQRESIPTHRKCLSVGDTATGPRTWNKIRGVYRKLHRDISSTFVKLANAVSHFISFDPLCFIKPYSLFPTLPSTVPWLASFHLRHPCFLFVHILTPSSLGARLLWLPPRSSAPLLRAGGTLASNSFPSLVEITVLPTWQLHWSRV